MFLFRTFIPTVLVVCLAGAALGQNKKASVESNLLTANGTIEKADKDALTIKPRGMDGRFQKAVALKITGTSKLSVLTPQKRGEKIVFTQRDIEAKDLAAGQTIAVIYAEAGKDDLVLLSAVAQPVAGK